MAERWFDPEELAELSRPTMDRAIEAIEGGDLDRAVELCADMKREWLMLHDLMAECVLGLVTFIQEQLGHDGVKAAWESGNERGWRRHHDAIQSVDRRKLVHLLAATWRAHSTSGVGEHPGAFTMTEDDEKVTFTMNPCGSGQRLVRRGLYEVAGAGAYERGARLVLRPRRLPALLHALQFHEREDADPVERISALPVGSARGLLHGSLHLVLVQGSGRGPRAPLVALRRRDAGQGRRALSARRALVTGATGGIGVAIAQRLRRVAAETVSHGITVNCVLPGLLATPKVTAMPEEVLDRFWTAGLLGTGGLGEPVEVAALVAFLASEEAGYVTGQEVVIAGGGELVQLSLGSSR